MADKFKSFYSHLDSPAQGAFSITPNDSTDLTTATRSIYIGGDGDLAVNMVDGTSVTFVGLKVGSVLPIRAARVLATGTSATNLVGLV